MKTVEQYIKDNNLDRLVKKIDDFGPEETNKEPIGPREEFIDLLCSINREGAKIEELISLLDASDFFYAPASTRYHNAFPGGLVDHCLNVYKNLVSIVHNKRLKYDPDSLKIVALLHDMSKMNYYETSVKNVKTYCEDGDRFDEIGKFKWDSVKVYNVRQAPNKFIFGSHEQASAFMVRQYIPLTLEEECAILHHMGGHGDVVGSADLTEIFNTYNLVILLHVADELSTFVDERLIYGE